jgi:hypothetical protein
VGAGSFPEIKLKCQYELDQKVLLLPIQGTGPGTIVMNKYRSAFRVRF